MPRKGAASRFYSDICDEFLGQTRPQTRSAIQLEIRGKLLANPVDIGRYNEVHLCVSTSLGRQGRLFAPAEWSRFRDPVVH